MSYNQKLSVLIGVLIILSAGVIYGGIQTHPTLEHEHRVDVSPPSPDELERADRAYEEALAFLASRDAGVSDAPVEIPGWRYTDSTDEMGRTMHVACVESTNYIHLRSPYEGQTFAHLCVRQHPEYGLDVFIRIDRGQIISYGAGERINVRFNDNDIEHFRINDSASGESTYVFISNGGERNFVESLLDSDSIRIELLIYRDGNQIFRFESNSRLEWELPRRARDPLRRYLR